MLHRPRVIRITARLNVGGIARHVTWLTAGLKDFETTLIAGRVPTGEQDMSAFVATHRVTPVFIPEMSREISLKDVVTVIKLFRRFLKERPDIIHTHSAKAGAVGRVSGWLYRWLTPMALLGRPRRCKLIHTFHGHIFHSYYGRLKTSVFLTIEKFLARLATDRIVVISHQQRREIHETFGLGRAEQFAVIPLGLELDVFAGWQNRRGHLRRELAAGNDTILVGIVGRLTEIKNHELFLEVAKTFQERFAGRLDRPVRFVVIGDGHLRPQLEATAKQLDLAKIVTFLGMRDDPEVFYPALDVVALTSLNEGTPLTLIEAMANERPVISTNAGGVVDLLGAPQQTGQAAWRICERGILVEQKNPVAFAEGLHELIKDEPLQQDLGRAGYAFVQEHYCQERLLRDVRRLYKGLLKHPAEPLRETSEEVLLETAQ